MKDNKEDKSYITFWVFYIFLSVAIILNTIKLFWDYQDRRILLTVNFILVSAWIYINMRLKNMMDIKEKRYLIRVQFILMLLFMFIAFWRLFL